MIVKQLYSQWKRIAFLYNWSAEISQRDKALKIIHDETKKVIKFRRSRLDSSLEIPAYGSLLVAQRESGLLTDFNVEEETNTCFNYSVSPQVLQSPSCFRSSPHI